MKRSRAYVGFIVPGFLIYSVFMIVPIVFAVYMSFFNWSGVGPMVPVGLANYQKLLFSSRESRIFFNALQKKLKYVGVVFLLSLINIRRCRRRLRCRSRRSQ